MSATPADLRQALRRIADWTPSELPVISAYLDLRPQAGANDPRMRSGQIVLRDRLRDHEKQLDDHTPAHDSLTADTERITRFVEDEALPESQGLAVFACHGEGLFETLDTARVLEDRVEVAGLPVIGPLARLADDTQAIVALADTNTLRLFASRSGRLEEIGLLDDEPDDYGKRSPGGWSQSRFQRHVEEHRAEFAALAAEAIGDVVALEDADVVVLAGDEVALPLIRDRLAQPVAELVRGTLRLEMRSTLDEVAGEALPFLEVVHADIANDAADRLVGAAKGDDMGIAGLKPTADALALGQVMELIVDNTAELDEATLEQLVRQAAMTDARIRFVDEHAGLLELGGVGGLLRFRLDRSINEPVED